jgi:predicted membrane protein
MEFEGQRKGEEVICIFRRHIATSFKGILWLIILVTGGFLQALLIPNNQYGLLICIIAIVLGFLGAVYSWLLWYCSYYIITNERLRQTRQKGLFKVSVVDLELENIINMSYGVHGIFATMFDYGSILIQTEAGDLVISMVSHPEAVYNELENICHDKK